MTPLSERRPDDDALVDYLLGTLSADDTERLDELSVADDEVAWRLQAAENDLVDAYVAGRLSGARLERFTSYYLSSPMRRERVALARALGSQPTRAATTRTPARPYGDRRRLPAWALAAAALIVTVALGYVAIENQRLRDQVNQSTAARVSSEQTAEALRVDLERERSTQEGMRNELDRLRTAAPPERAPIQALILLPMRRGAGEVPTVSVSRRAGHLPLRLRLEGNVFPRYQATLRDSSSGQAVWRSPAGAARPAAANETVAVDVPVALLRSANYTLELTGSTPNAAPEFVNSYAFRVVVE